MKLKRFKISLLLIVLSVFLHGCTLNENSPSTNNCADNNVSVEDQHSDNVIVKVNDQCIYHDEINDVFLQQFGPLGISYAEIVENSIDELVATSYAEKLGVSVSDDEIEKAIEEYQAVNKDLYDKALKVYGKRTLQQKIKDRLLFVSTKNKVLEEKVNIDSHLIESFKNQKEFHGKLDNYSDAELMKRLDKEIKDYAFRAWVKEKRKESKIEYLTLYDKYKKDSLVFNDHQTSMLKFDGKEVPLDGDEKKEILNSLPVFEPYDASSVNEILVKPRHKNDYTEHAFIEVYFVNRDNNDQTLQVTISDTNQTGIDYGLKDSKISTLCGVDVKLSKSENVNMHTKIILRAVFKVDNTTYVMEGANIEPFDFTKMVSVLLSKLTGE